MLVIRAGICKILVSIASRGDPDQTASKSDLGLHCLSRPFCQAISVQNFRTFTIHVKVAQWLSGRVLDLRP